MVWAVTAVTYARNKIAFPLSLYPLLSFASFSMAALSDSGDDFQFESARTSLACRFYSISDRSIAHG